MAALKKNIPVAISAIALIISVVTLYTTSIKPANITFALGDWMEISHSNYSALYINLPIALRNTGAQAGLIRSLGVILKDPETEEAIFLKWLGFTKLEQSQGYWMWESRGTPVSVPAHSDITKMAKFYGGGSVAGWIPKARKYNLYLLAWTSESQMPSVKLKSTWIFNESDVSEIKRKYEEKEYDSPTWIFSSVFGPDTKKLSILEFNELVNSNN
jgi:hypothetical protein